MEKFSLFHLLLARLNKLGLELGCLILGHCLGNLLFKDGLGMNLSWVFMRFNRDELFVDDQELREEYCGSSRFSLLEVST